MSADIIDSYTSLIARKDRRAEVAGFDDDVTDGWLFPFQRHAVRWALAGGRRALFMDTGLGKSRMQLRWADGVARRTGGRVIVLAPLAVGPQTVREAASVGVAGVVFAQSPADLGNARIVVTNYDSIDHFDAAEFAGVVLDESSILKSFTGRTTASLIAAFRDTPYKLACTATPSPNDHTELGTHAEFLGQCTRSEMLSRYFVNDLSDTKKWRVKGHARESFWEWVASWALCAGMPSDVGPYADDGYVLPALVLHRHVVNVDLATDRADGFMFRMGNLSATGVHGEKRRTLEPRADKVAELVASEPGEPWLVWCETDYEAEALMSRLPAGTVEVSGSMNPATKADRLLGFADRGGVLVTKPRIAGFGMNWQNCARMVISGGTYSYEAFYQLVRRSWRFGQSREVHVHVVMAYTEQHMWDVVSRKSADHDEMKREMFAASRRVQGASAASRDPYNPRCHGRLPAWLVTR